MAGVRIAVRDMVERNESQIYNWSIKKEAAVPTELGPSETVTRVISHKLPLDEAALPNDLVPSKDGSLVDGTSAASVNPTVAQTASGVNSKYMPTNNVVIPTIEDIVRKTGEGMNLTEEQVAALQRDPNVRSNYNRMVQNIKQIAEGRGSGYNDGRIDLNEMGGQINGREAETGASERSGQILRGDSGYAGTFTGEETGDSGLLQKLSRETTN